MTGQDIGFLPLEIRAGMDEAEIESACIQALLQKHAVALPGAIGHHKDDYDLIWQADGSAVLNIRIWQDMAPPFRHVVVVVNLAFEAGCVSEIGTIRTHHFSA